MVAIFEYIVVLTVQFSRREYTGSEGNGFLSVVVDLSGGISSDPFNVTVNPSELVPPRAVGKFSYVMLVICIMQVV